MLVFTVNAKNRQTHRDGCTHSNRKYLAKVVVKRTTYTITHIHRCLFVSSRVCRSVCVCAVRATAGGLSPHFCKRVSSCSANPVPDLSHPESDRGWSASYFIERRARAGGSAHSHTLSPLLTPPSVYASSLLNLSPLVLFPPSALGEARSLLKTV